MRIKTGNRYLEYSGPHLIRSTKPSSPSELIPLFPAISQAQFSKSPNPYLEYLPK
jgi:hypothetical protein